MSSDNQSEINFESKETVGIFPGSFDPLTWGHLDLISRSLPVFQKVILIVAKSPEKQCWFSVEERVQMIKAAVSLKTGLFNLQRYSSRIEIVGFEGLLVQFLKKYPGSIVIRGLRNNMDTEYEMQLEQIHRSLDPQYQSVFLLARPEHRSISSTMVKEVARLGGLLSNFVPPNVEVELKKKSLQFLKI